jgi:hypothetical protein
MSLGQIKPQFFLTRQNGSVVPMIAMDELPIHVQIRGVSRNLCAMDDTAGMTSVGLVQARHQFYEIENMNNTKPIMFIPAAVTSPCKGAAVSAFQSAVQHEANIDTNLIDLSTESGNVSDVFEEKVDRSTPVTNVAVDTTASKVMFGTISPRLERATTDTSHTAVFNILEVTTSDLPELTISDRPEVTTTSGALADRTIVPHADHTIAIASTATIPRALEVTTPKFSERIFSGNCNAKTKEELAAEIPVNMVELNSERVNHSLIDGTVVGGVPLDTIVSIQAENTISSSLPENTIARGTPERMIYHKPHGTTVGRLPECNLIGSHSNFNRSARSSTHMVMKSESPIITTGDSPQGLSIDNKPSVHPSTTLSWRQLASAEGVPPPLSHRTPSNTQPVVHEAFGSAPRQKVYCSHWLKTGECSFVQQGCLYKHEMPMDLPTLLSLGLRDIPDWYRQANGLGSLQINGGRNGLSYGIDGANGGMAQAFRPRARLDAAAAHRTISAFIAPNCCPRVGNRQPRRISAAHNVFSSRKAMTNAERAAEKDRHDARMRAAFEADAATTVAGMDDDLISVREAEQAGWKEEQTSAHKASEDARLKSESLNEDAASQTPCVPVVQVTKTGTNDSDAPTGTKPTPTSKAVPNTIAKATAAAGTTSGTESTKSATKKKTTHRSCRGSGKKIVGGGSGGRCVIKPELESSVGVMAGTSFDCGEAK